MPLPQELHINAYTGIADPGSPLHPNAKRWVGKEIDRTQGALRPPALLDMSDWRDPRVGWGLVLPDDPNLTAAAKATAEDAPEPIQRLVEARRAAPVYRFSPTLPITKLRRCFTDGTCQDPDFVISPTGAGPGAIPQYLLIYAPPTKIPWAFQYLIAAGRFVGRLDLEGDALENYITALINDWAGATSRVNRAVTWAVDHGEGDITHLMRRVVAYKLHKRLASDEEIGEGAIFLDGKERTITCEDLIAALKQYNPSMVVTSSHGMTGPLDDVPIMASQLGLPVDANHHLLQPDELLRDWSPEGAIWYAHACCGAGGDSHTGYEGLVAVGSYADQILKGVNKAGSLIAPLPRALLGAPHPLRAFIGHVEPTFDWTLRDRDTGQVRTDALVSALYERLYQPMPIGFALEPCHAQGPRLDSVHKRIIREYGLGTDRLEEALTCQLIAQDLQSLVILGDPTAALPPLGPDGGSNSE